MIEGFESLNPFTIIGKSTVLSTETFRILSTNWNEDILSEIFKFCNPADLFSVMLSCKQFNIVANKENVWYHLCKYHHPNVTYRLAMKTFEEMTPNQIDSIDEENNVFKMYYKNRGWVVQKSIQYIQNLYLAHIPSSISYKTFITSATNSDETKQVILKILRNEGLVS